MSSIRPKRASSGFSDYVVWGLAVAFVLAALISSALVFSTVRTVVASWSETGLPDLFSPTVSESDSESSPGGDEIPAAVPTISLQADLPEWSGSERVNILLMGLDYRDWESGDGPPRTDSMMLVTMDPVSKSAGMLSIPRDLWVEVPGFEHNRINTAYFLGEANRLPGGGAGLAVKTVEKFLGVPIQFYAVIDFEVFEQFVDEIGGIEVLVKERIKISPRYRESYYLDPKAHLLNGRAALAYARARKTDGGDFDRAERQQQVALAIRDRILELDMVPVLLAKAPSLYGSAVNKIDTNLTLNQVIELGLLAMQVDKDEVKKGVIAPPEMVLFETFIDGAQVLKPVPEKIRILRDEIFTGTGAIAPSIDKPEEAVGQEGARVAVLNGAGVEGLATDTADYLTAQGLYVVEIANADRLDYDKSRLLVHSRQYPYTMRYLEELLGLTQGQVLNPVTTRGDVDLVLILGRDWANGGQP
jgi:LCP family protein required for cell wall assembly